ncbi:MAG: hypothetical protein IJ685_01330 [Selenomonadaceae bacterium]|nr:hypothetical protein [Selenomonadaceae bacterium]
MANEKFADEIISDDELDNVAGGTLWQTADDMNRFTAATGMRFTGDHDQQREQFREILFSCGIKIKDHGGGDANEYYLLNAQGKKVQALTEDQAMNIAINNYRIGYRIC